MADSACDIYLQQLWRKSISNPRFSSFCCAENVPVRNSDVDYRLLEAAKAGDLDTVKVICLFQLYI